MPTVPTPLFVSPPPRDLAHYGLTASEVLPNPSYAALFAEEMRPELTGFARASLTELGAVNVNTGAFTGRSPKINTWSTMR
ncbi:MAG: hypothetical protein ACRCYV_08910 [Aeromonas sp.]